MNKYLTILFLFLSNFTYSQSNISFKAIGINYLFSESKNYDIIKNQEIINNLYFEPGINLSYDKFITDDYFSVRISQAFYKDKSKKNAGFTLIGLRRKLYNKYQHSFNVSLGPSLIYRKSWANMTDYKNENDFLLHGSNLEYRFKILNIELEYNYSYSKKADFCLSISHNMPYEIGISLGVRYWINKKIKKKKCMSCPNFN